MGLKEIVETYKTLKSSTDLILECKEKGITRCDLENNQTYPELSQRLSDLDEKGKNRPNALDFGIAYWVNMFKNYHSVMEAHEYGCKHIYACTCCKLKGNKE